MVRWLSTMVGLAYTKHGSPLSAIQLMRMPRKHLENENEVRVAIHATSFNHADINTIEGKYPLKPSSAHHPLMVAGSEAVGQVVESKADSIKEGDVVIFTRGNLGTWVEELVVHKSNLHVIKPSMSLSSMPIKKLVQYSMLGSTYSTACKLLEQKDLKQGDAIIQNGANSAVGQSIIQLANLKGIKSINIVRRMEVKDKLLSLGGDLVSTVDSLKDDLRSRADLPRPVLALNCVGGSSSSAIAKALDVNGLLVTFGGMAKEPVQIPTSNFIFKNICAKGFWNTGHILPNLSWEDRDQMLSYLTDLLNTEKLKIETEELPLSSWEKAFTMKSRRKIVFTPQVK